MHTPEFEFSCPHVSSEHVIRGVCGAGKMKHLYLDGVFVFDRFRVNCLRSYKILLGSKEGAGRYRAIWDTGATHSLISKKIIDELGLKAIEIGNQHTAGGVSETSFHNIDIALPTGIVFPALEVSLNGDIFDFDVIIGMDIISQGDFAVFHGKKTSRYIFRYPPQDNSIWSPED